MQQTIESSKQEIVFEEKKETETVEQNSTDEVNVEKVDNQDYRCL